ncbi:lysM and putative peptidoglycan-binding domain-containing protein 2 [Sitodiplosis mosellana]|uniref:lysM and putative peptidoglycan-binding domain-containing protein 2 n=1 Tax=Sitodiplosis mosellana TaxID=263140 RepID=UPI00244374F2|nr:lysM and putative peptidoglycan-binding domain-containing protein 2 [Sitodiplosis mosellana]XP_055325547.1 lysM and putative peptidoglycan-binding domain-containing protein 2 [Sitodiplosis mosellana]XP_055325548.1 lysM and putative peptidoglycan-binding domain-containing protein 2 [Sitodiplosis mosellana]XP_055325549.1 lysM and putative peptidoglycan-binding domain-containing protein 2 [Sitodiplosis mosellana]
MESDNLFNERQSIRDSARQLKKYGSTCNHVRNNEYLIRHNLQQTDTLQGIALKYGCTTEQIRRVNRLFAQDSLFLRQYLMIPVDRDTSLQHNQFVKSMSLPANADDTESPTYAGSSRLPSPNASNSPTANLNDNILSPDEESKKSIEDFLGKIDSNLAKTKKYVKNSQSSLNKLASIEDNDFQENTHSAAAYALSSSYHSGGYGSSGASNGTQMVVTHGKRVKTSLHRLEEQQDEFYQL